jgi:glucuronate isomerase
MPYLTYEEYNELQFGEIENTEFEKLLNRASDVLDNVTCNFYRVKSLEDDGTFRRERFKKAVAAQVNYFHDMGATSSHDINSPLTVQIGRTEVSSGAKNQREMNSLVSKDVYFYLNGTGLLYRGLGVLS